MTLTIIRLLSESDAMRAVGPRSAGNWTFSVVGDRAHEVIAWIEAEPLHTTMNGHWVQGRLLAVYVMFERAVHSEKRRQAVSNALAMFATAFKGTDGWQWRDDGVVPHVSKLF